MRRWNSIPFRRIATASLMILGMAMSTPSQAFTDVYYYRMKRAGSHSCLDVSGSGTADGTNIQQWTCNESDAQSFRVRAAGRGWVNLINKNSKKCVDVNSSGTADGTNIQLWTCNGTDAQKFYPESTGTLGFYRLKSAISGKCLDVSGDNGADGTNIQLCSCNGTNAQTWKIEGWDGCFNPEAYLGRVKNCEASYAHCAFTKRECLIIENFCIGAASTACH